jgi:zinc-binding alcohol dehydrogenase family protein
MRAVVHRKALPVTDPDCFIDAEIERPQPGPHDLLVRVEAVSVNPVDAKTRAGGDPPGGERVLGFDAAGVVAEVGAAVTLFRPGDAVFYAGSIVRPGANSEYHLVDERIVGHKPATIRFAEAAALPLTAITAYELLFHRIGVRPGDSADRRSLLIVGGAGGVGSVAIQFARALTGLTVVATAARPDSVGWCRALGAHHVVDHSAPFAPQLSALGFDAVDIVLGLTHTAEHWPQLAALVAPLGHFGVIDNLPTVDFTPLRGRSTSLHYELMFTRPRFGTADMIEQHRLLEHVARLVDAGRIKTTMTEIVGPIDAAHLREAHRRIESGRTIGKLVLAGFGRP